MTEEQETIAELRLHCVCGGEISVQAQLLGRIIPCRHCGRHLRPALQFLMVDREFAPNLTVQCTCGHFIVGRADRSGRRAKCAVCSKEVILPQPVMRPARGVASRVPKRVLENQLLRVRRRRPAGGKSQEITRLETAARSGRVDLRPGEHICLNPECGALLGPGASVCPRCGTNRMTGERYEGPGPDADPVSEWKQV